MPEIQDSGVVFKGPIISRLCDALRSIIKSQIDCVHEIIRKRPQITDTDEYLRLVIVIFVSNLRVQTGQNTDGRADGQTLPSALSPGYAMLRGR